MHDSFEREAKTAAPTPSVPLGERLGATLLGGSRCEFRVWAPFHEIVEVHILWPDDRRVPLRKRPDGYHDGIAENCPPGARYRFVIGGEERPDPASRSQPEGVHGPSEVVTRDFAWTDRSWKGLPLEEFAVYELHVGTFTAEGTFDAIIPHLDELKDLGITAVELLPVAQFPGSRNWGYDGTYAGAAQSSYGGPVALKRLVDACHQRGMAILLDVVFNHLGPEGNYLAEFGPYFTDRYHTPWGLAINFDGSRSDHVRWFFIHCALQWVDEFHIDGLRIDAVHAIVDHTAQPFLQDLSTAIRARAHELGRRIHSIAESDLNDPRVITPAEQLGLGFDAQWNDDFHHSLHTLLTGESGGYYVDYGRASDLARVMRSGYLFVGQHSRYRARRYGLAPDTTDGAKFIVCAQNHDQVGNRMTGDRLAAMVPQAKLRLAAAAVVLSPFLPMLFMGEEYGETAPFQYFTSHSDHDLIEAVRKGRREEFDDFRWEGQTPDPHDEQTFRRSKLTRAGNASLRALYKDLFRLRREQAALRVLDLAAVEVHADDDRKVLLVSRSAVEERVLLAFNFSDEAQEVGIPFRDAKWKTIFATETTVGRGIVKLPPLSFGIFEA